MEAAAQLTVRIHLNAETLRDAEKTLDDLLRPYEDDDRLVSYYVAQSDWVPMMFAESHS